MIVLTIIFGVMILTAVFKALADMFIHKEDDPDHLRGRQLISFETARRRAEALLKQYPDDDQFDWGGLTFPASSILSKNAAIVADPGAGKTLLLSVFITSCFKSMERHPDSRMLLFDAKGDVYASMQARAPSFQVLYLCPFSDGPGAAAWDIRTDVGESPAAFNTVASFLVPQDGPNASQPFFVVACQTLLASVIEALVDSGANWDFGDLITIGRDRDLLKAVLASCSRTKHLVDDYLTHPETARSLSATLNNKLAPLSAIGAGWRHAQHKVSIKSWLSGQSVLVLPHSEEYRTSIRALNQLLISLIAAYGLSQPDSTTRRTYVLMDEFKLLGRLDGANSMLLAGRSKGIFSASFFQSIPGLQAELGEHGCSDLIGLSPTIGVLRVSSSETAKVASEIFGHYERRERHESTSENNSEHGSSLGRTASSNIISRSAVLPSEFQSLPATSPKSGIFGYFISPVGAYKADPIPWPWVMERIPTIDPQLVRTRRAAADLILPPLTDTDRARLKLAAPAPASTRSSKRMVEDTDPAKVFDSLMNRLKQKEGGNK